MIREENVKHEALSALRSLNGADQAFIFEQLDSDTQIAFAKGVLGRLNDREIKALISELPCVAEKRAGIKTGHLKVKSDFSEIFKGERCSLAVRSTNRGREVRLTLNGGSTYDRVFLEINELSNKKYNCHAIEGSTSLRHSSRYSRISKTTVLTFIPVLRDGRGRVKVGRYMDNHAAMFEKLDSGLVDELALVAAAGAFRVANGFPRYPYSLPDKGDLFDGYWVRACTGAFQSSRFGVTEMNLIDIWTHMAVSALTPFHSAVYDY